MRRIAICVLVGAAATSSPSAAHDTATAFPSRGACESASAGMSNDEQDWLLETFPDVFASKGEVSSFLTKAWTCDQGSDRQYYITDHRVEVLDGYWFNHRKK